MQIDLFLLSGTGTRIKMSIEIAARRKILLQTVNICKTFFFFYKVFSDLMYNKSVTLCLHLQTL